MSDSFVWLLEILVAERSRSSIDSCCRRSCFPVAERSRLFDRLPLSESLFPGAVLCRCSIDYLSDFPGASKTYVLGGLWCVIVGGTLSWYLRVLLSSQLMEHSTKCDAINYDIFNMSIFSL